MEIPQYISDIRADDLFIEADMRDDCLEDCTDPFPSEPNPNFPDIDFDEHEDYPEGDPWKDGEPCLTPTWLD